MDIQWYMYVHYIFVVFLDIYADIQWYIYIYMVVVWFQCLYRPINHSPGGCMPGNAGTYIYIHTYIYSVFNLSSGYFRLRPLEDFWRKLLTLESKGRSLVWEVIMLSEWMSVAKAGGAFGGGSVSLEITYKMGPYLIWWNRIMGLL